MYGKIQSDKCDVQYWERRANRYGEELKQLASTIKEEGLFCVEWCVMSVSTVSCGTSSVVYHGWYKTVRWFRVINILTIMVVIVDALNNYYAM